MFETIWHILYIFIPGITNTTNRSAETSYEDEFISLLHLTLSVEIEQNEPRVRTGTGNKQNGSFSSSNVNVKIMEVGLNHHFRPLRLKSSHVVM